MTLQKLAIFAAVARHRSLTKASQELAISEPSVSLHLKELQQHYSTQLFRRVSKGVVLTADGQAFLRRVVPILNQVAQLKQGPKVAHLKAASPMLRVGGTSTPSAVLLPKLLARMHHQYPRADLELRTRTSNQLQRLLSRSLLDLAVSARVPPSAGLESELFRREKVALFVAANHRLAKRSNVQLCDLLKEPLVLRGGLGSSGLADKAIENLRAGGAEIKIAMYCDGPTSVKAAVRQKIGVGVVLADSIKAEVASGEFKILKVPGVDLVGESYIVYAKKRPLSPIAQEFLEMLRRERDRINSKTRSTGSRRSKSSRVGPQD